MTPSQYNTILNDLLYISIVQIIIFAITLAGALTALWKK